MKKPRLKDVRNFLILLLAVAILTPIAALVAETPNPSPASTGYETLVLHMPGPYTATATPVQFKAPWPYRVLSVSAFARVIKTSAGSETYTLDVKQASTSLLSAPMAIATQATVTDATLATNPRIPDESTVSLILTLGGDTPSVTDLTAVIAVKRQ